MRDFALRAFAPVPVGWRTAYVDHEDPTTVHIEDFAGWGLFDFDDRRDTSEGVIAQAMTYTVDGELIPLGNHEHGPFGPRWSDDGIREWVLKEDQRQKSM